MTKICYLFYILDNVAAKPNEVSGTIFKYKINETVIGLTPFLRLSTCKTSPNSYPRGTYSLSQCSVMLNIPCNIFFVGFLEFPYKYINKLWFDFLCSKCTQVYILGFKSFWISRFPTYSKSFYDLLTGGVFTSSSHDFFTAGVLMILQQKFLRSFSRLNVLKEVWDMKL